MMNQQTSFGKEKQFIRTAVSLEVAQRREGSLVMLDVVGGCLDSWIDEGLVINKLPDQIVIVNKNKEECNRLSAITIKRLAHTRINVVVVCADMYDHLRTLLPSTVSALFCDHNQTVAYLETVRFAEIVSRACMDGAYVAITSSLRMGDSISRLQRVVQGLGKFSTQTPFTYNTNGPMGFFSGRVCKTVLAETPIGGARKRKHLIDASNAYDQCDIETLLRNGKVRPIAKRDLQPGSLVECGNRNRWLLLIEKHESVAQDLFDVKCVKRNQILHMSIDVKDVKRVAHNVPAELLATCPRWNRRSGASDNP
jgi:hypothetical protein